MNALSDAQKYHLLKHHDKPSDSFIFPVTHVGGCNRAFRREWFDEFEWLVYSTELDGAFCISCALFVKHRNGLGVLVNKPFRSWHKKATTVRGHCDLDYHDAAVKDAASLMHRFENAESTLPVKFDSQKQYHIKRNRHIVRSVAEAVLFCGRQCIGLRGDAERGDATGGNPGNFIAACTATDCSKRRCCEESLGTASYEKLHVQVS